MTTTREERHISWVRGPIHVLISHSLSSLRSMGMDRLLSVAVGMHLRSHLGADASRVAGQPFGQTWPFNTSKCCVQFRGIGQASDGNMRRTS